MAEYIPRSSYLEKIKPFIGKDIIKVLTGQRRVGKSFILLQLMDEVRRSYENANIISINLELYEFSSIKTYSSLYEYVDARIDPDKRNFLFIDEVQEVKSFELCLRSLLAEKKCDITCTGSNAMMLSGELSTTLSGRYVQFPVYSLSYTEFIHFHNLENTNENLNLYLKFGGMPYLIHTGLQSDVVFEYLKNLNSTILLKDVVSRENIRNVSFLENLTAYLADNTGNLISAHNISKFLKSQRQNVPTQTILNYLKALGNAFYIYKVNRADVVGLKIFEIGEKYYFEDLGLRNSIRAFDYRNDINKLMENVVYLHLLRSGYRVFVGKLGDKEIDFVAEKDGDKMYVQVCYMIADNQIMQREFGNLMAVENHYPKFVVTMDEVSAGANWQGIRQIHLRDFLMM